MGNVFFGSLFVFESESMVSPIKEKKRLRELHEHTSDEFEVDMSQEISSPKEKSLKTASGEDSATVDPKETTGQEKSGNEEDKVEHESYEHKEVKEALLLALSETNVSPNGETPICEHADLRTMQILEDADLRTAGELELPEMETQEPRNQFLASCFSLCHIRFRV